MGTTGKVIAFFVTVAAGAAGMGYWDHTIQQFQQHMVEKELADQVLQPAVDVHKIGLHGPWADVLGEDEAWSAPKDVQGIEDANAKAKSIFSTPGGAYTQKDIALNGTTPPYERFHRIRYQFAMRPFPGQPIDPILKTKASPAFSWFVGGQRYHFASIASMEEFVIRAKKDPSSILPADQYIEPGTPQKEA